MKRTYVDLLGEYYDNNDLLNDEAYRFGLRGHELRKVYQEKRRGGRKRFKVE